MPRRSEDRLIPTSLQTFLQKLSFSNKHSTFSSKIKRSIKSQVIQNGRRKVIIYPQALDAGVIGTVLYVPFPRVSNLSITS